VVYQRLVPRIDGGMVAAYEVLTGTIPVRNLVKEGKASQLRNNIVMGQHDGMQTLEMSLTELVAAGVVSYDEAIARSLFPRDVKRHSLPAQQ
jgi:twitching motility protein PilT